VRNPDEPTNRQQLHEAPAGRTPNEPERRWNPHAAPAPGNSDQAKRRRKRDEGRPATGDPNEPEPWEPGRAGQMEPVARTRRARCRHPGWDDRALCPDEPRGTRRPGRWSGLAAEGDLRDRR
jgi:hypothetical protein